MAAPTYTWKFKQNLYGLPPAPVMVLEASANLETRVGTALVLASGQLDEATANVAALAGFSEIITAAPLSAGDPVKFTPIRPGDVWVGTADADGSSLDGFNGKTIDMNPDGTLDVGDTSNGCFSIWYTENGGLTVYCVCNSAKMAIQ